MAIAKSVVSELFDHKCYVSKVEYDSHLNIKYVYFMDINMNMVIMNIIVNRNIHI